MDKIKVGDDVTIGGKVVKVYTSNIWVELKSGNCRIIPREDIKTHRPAGKGGDAE